MNAKVNIQIGVMSRKRDDSERFRPTKTWTCSFPYMTDLDNYTTLTPSIGTTTYNYAASERAAGAETSTHVSVRLDNPTHPTPAKGVIPLAKQFKDTAYSDGEFISAQFITNELNSIVKELREKAKY